MVPWPRWASHAAGPARVSGRRPVRHSFVDPQSQVAASLEAGFGPRPILDTVAGPRDAMTAGGVELERHAERVAGPILPGYRRPAGGPCTNGDQRHTQLSLACGGPARCRARHPGAGPGRGSVHQRRSTAHSTISGVRWTSTVSCSTSWCRTRQGVRAPTAINGTLNYLWRAVDQHGVVLDILVQDRRNATAAKRFFKRLLQGLRYKPRRLITDGLRSYGVAHREVLPDVRHRTSRYLNNRAENSHRPTRRRERQMQRFKSSAQAQRFLSAHGMIYGHFRPRRHLMIAADYRRARAKSFRIWRQETCVQMAV